MHQQKGYVGIVIIVILLLAGGAVIMGIPDYAPSPPITGNTLAGSCGGWGQTCCSDNVCYQGECQAGACIHCGFFGEVCCNERSDGSACDPGSECLDGMCKVKDDYYSDCGRIGYPPCQDDLGPYCYQGVLDTFANICAACGDYEQACCSNSECSYGECVNGVCKLVSNSGSMQTNTGSSTSGTDTSGTSSGQSGTVYDDCGEFEQECCQDWREVYPGGATQIQVWCKGDLSCSANICVEGPVSQSNPRPSY